MRASVLKESRFPVGRPTRFWRVFGMARKFREETTEIPQCGATEGRTAGGKAPQPKVAALTQKKQNEKCEKSTLLGLSVDPLFLKSEKFL